MELKRPRRHPRRDGNRGSTTPLGESHQSESSGAKSPYGRVCSGPAELDSQPVPTQELSSPQLQEAHRCWIESIFSGLHLKYAIIIITVSICESFEVTKR